MLFSPKRDYPLRVPTYKQLIAGKHQTTATFDSLDGPYTGLAFTLNHLPQFV